MDDDPTKGEVGRPGRHLMSDARGTPVKLPCLGEVPLHALVEAHPSAPASGKIIQEHLNFYVSLAQQVTPVHVEVHGKLGRVVYGLEHLHAAKQAGLSSVRAIIVRASSERELHDFMLSSGFRVEQAFGMEVGAHEPPAPPTLRGWHVLYFEQPLSDDQVERVETILSEVVVSMERLSYEHDHVWFLARTEDTREFAIEFLRALSILSSTVGRVVSHQGSRILLLE